MPVEINEIKIVFTAFGVLVTPFVLLLKITSGSDWHWRLGRYDPVRNLLFRRDGSLRKYSKLGMLIWIWGVVAIIWLTE